MSRTARSAARLAAVHEGLERIAVQPDGAEKLALIAAVMEVLVAMKHESYDVQASAALSETCVLQPWNLDFVIAMAIGLTERAA